MKLIEFIQKLKELENIYGNFEVQLDLDHCKSPDKINISFEENNIILTQGNCGL